MYYFSFQKSLAVLIPVHQYYDSFIGEGEGDGSGWDSLDWYTEEDIDLLIN